MLKSLFTPGGELDSLILANIDAVNADSIENTMLQLQNMGTRFMLAPNRKQVALWLKDRFESVGCPVTAIDSFQTHTTIFITDTYIDTVTWQYNVIATIPGHLNPEKISAVGGHYDCYTTNNPFLAAPGADDNASSVATIIELARVINSSGYSPNKTIRFLALGAEELMYYSSVSGARDYADKCALNQEDLQVYINNDMIANEPAADGWIVDYLVHDAEFWTTPLTVGLSGEYTAITPNVMVQGNFGADDLPFWQAGFQTGYFFEHNFCPYYHTENDVVANCNMEYCSEVARLNMALLLSVTEMPEPVESFVLHSTGEGGSLKAIWEPLDESDITEYRLQFGTAPDALTETVTTGDTTYLFPGLHPDTLYYASISAVNSRGNLSSAILRHARPAAVTLDQGILVISGSQEGLLDPPQEEIDSYYASLCTDFDHDLLDATAVEELRLEVIGKYSSLLLHIDNPDWPSSILPDHLDVLRNYLYLGGHLLFTGFRPARILETAVYPAIFKEGSFFYDCLKIKTSYNEAGRLFAGAYPVEGAWTPLYVDSLKMPIFNYHLPFVEVFEPAPDGAVPYRYDTEYDTLTSQGSYYGLPVGIHPAGPEKQTFTLGFPLYYMDSLQSKQLVFKVMADLFGEQYLDVEDRPGTPVPELTVYPNPAGNTVHFAFRTGLKGPAVIRVLDITGKEVHRMNSGQSQEMAWDTRHMPAGMYIYRAACNGHVESGKLILAR